MDKNILLDLANETGRKIGHDGNITPDFVDKLSKRIKRKFSSKVETQIISELVIHYTEIYKFAKSIFKAHLKPPTGKFAQPGDVDENFIIEVKKRFPADDEDILLKICGWVVCYEYLL